MFFLFCATSFSSIYCQLWISQNLIRKLELELAYSINGSSLIDIPYKGSNDNKFLISSFTPYNLKIYLKYNYCTDMISFFEKNITNEEECIDIELTTDMIPDKCQKGVDVIITNGIEYTYDITVINQKNESYKLYSRQDIKFLSLENFTLDIYVSSDFYLDGSLNYLETIYVNSSNMTFTYNLSSIPVDLRPYRSCFTTQDFPYFYRVAYYSKHQQGLWEIRNEKICLDYVTQEETIIYLISTIKCKFENASILLKIKSERDPIMRVITLDDIPEECIGEDYPDDTPKYQPDKNANSSIPYSFVFLGICDKFDDLINRCKNGTVKYPLCPFVNKAIQCLCSSSFDNKIYYEVSPYADKLYVTGSRVSDVDFSGLKHQMIVHIKGTNISDPKYYFKNYDSPGPKEYVRINGNISSKVSFLIAENTYIYSDKMPFYVDNFYLKHSDNIHTHYPKMST